MLTIGCPQQVCACGNSTSTPRRRSSVTDRLAHVGEHRVVDAGDHQGDPHPAVLLLGRRPRGRWGRAATYSEAPPSDGRESRTREERLREGRRGACRGLPRDRLQRAQPPRPGQRDHPRPGRGRDARARLRPQRVGPDAAHRHQPDPRLRHARRREPVLHRRRHGHGGRRRGGRALGLCSATATSAPSARAAYLDPAAAAAGPGRPGDAGGPESPLLEEIRRRGTPVVIVDRTRDDATFCSVAVDDVLGGRLADRAPPRARARARRLRRRAGCEIGQVRDRLAGARAAWADGRPACRRPDRGRDRLASTSPAGARRAQRLARLPAAAAAQRGVLRQRPARARPAPAARSAPGLRVPEDLAIVGYDDIEFAAAAAVPLSSVRQPRAELGRAPPSCCSTRRRPRRTSTARSSSPPSCVARRSTG